MELQATYAEPCSRGFSEPLQGRPFYGRLWDPQPVFFRRSAAPDGRAGPGKSREVEVKSGTGYDFLREGNRGTFDSFRFPGRDGILIARRRHLTHAISSGWEDRNNRHRARRASPVAQASAVVLPRPAAVGLKS